MRPKPLLRQGGELRRLRTIPLNSALPSPEFTGQTGEAGGENPIMERESGKASM